MKNLGMIYEGHFYHDMDTDMQNQYYGNIVEAVKPFAEKCHGVAIEIQRLKYEVENMFYTNEWKTLEQSLEAYTEDPKLEKREFQTYLVDIMGRLEHACSDMTKDNIQSYFTDVLTGSKIQ